MKFIYCLLLALLFSPHSLAAISVSCGASKGYAYYFEGGLVEKNKSGFTDDGLSGGQFTLTVDAKRKGEVLSKDATGALKSATSQGGVVTVIDAPDNGFNWLILYPDGTLEIYSFNISSMKVASYRNTVGNALVAKNSLFISDCKVI